MPSISVAGNTLFSVIEARMTDVGAGGGNTAAMLLAGDTGGAAHAADLYEHGGYADWFLPSRDELAAMIAVPEVAETLVGGAGYWSPTEASNGITTQSLSAGGELRAIAKPEPYRRRPLRRFTAGRRQRSSRPRDGLPCCLPRRASPIRGGADDDAG
jgi:hypothetical protein